MKYSKLSPLAAAASVALAMSFGGLAQAHPVGAHAVLFQTETAGAVVARDAMPRIDGFDVKSVPAVEAGAELEFTLWGTPGGQASIRIDGAQRALALDEVAAGMYRGAYVVSKRDRIVQGSAVTGQLRVGNRISTARLDSPLQAGWPLDGGSYANADAAVGPMPQIARVNVTPMRDAQGREGYAFEVTGTAGARASVDIAGAQPRLVFLDETRAGVYTGTYLLRDGQTLDTTQPVVARLRLGERVVSQASSRGWASGAARAVPRNWNTWCADCGTVEAVNRVEIEGDGTIGTVAGGVIGAVLGNQVGKGDGRTAARVAGAVGGALLGREIDKRQGRKQQYEIVVRMPDGSQQRVQQDADPQLAVGQAVRIVNGAVQAAQR